MILIGQYDSPFVRRVAIALVLYGIDYTHRPWSVFGDAERVAAFNPLVRVPVLILEDGETLVDSATILDHLDEQAGGARAMLPREGPSRRAGLRICALATGLADKAVSLVYERVLHAKVSAAWVSRCTDQIGRVLLALEHDRALRSTRYWHNDTIGHADIAVGCAMRFLAEAHPGLLARDDIPALTAHAAALETSDAFRRVYQRFDPPR